MKRFWLFSCLLGTVATPLLGQDFTITKLPGQAAALSSSGKVTGGPEPAYVWSRTGGVQYLGDLGLANSTYPQAINKTGEVVGQSTLADGVAYHAFLWTSSKGMQDLGRPKEATARRPQSMTPEKSQVGVLRPTGPLVMRSSGRRRLGLWI